MKLKLLCSAKFYYFIYKLKISIPYTKIRPLTFLEEFLLNLIDKFEDYNFVDISKILRINPDIIKFNLLKLKELEMIDIDLPIHNEEYILEKILLQFVKFTPSGKRVFDLKKIKEKQKLTPCKDYFYDPINNQLVDNVKNFSVLTDEKKQSFYISEDKFIINFAEQANLLKNLFETKSRYLDKEIDTENIKFLFEESIIEESEDQYWCKENEISFFLNDNLCLDYECNSDVKKYLETNLKDFIFSILDTKLTTDIIDMENVSNYELLNKDNIQKIATSQQLEFFNDYNYLIYATNYNNFSNRFNENNCILPKIELLNTNDHKIREISLSIQAINKLQIATLHIPLDNNKYFTPLLVDKYNNFYDVKLGVLQTQFLNRDKNILCYATYKYENVEIQNFINELLKNYSNSAEYIGFISQFKTNEEIVDLCKNKLFFIKEYQKLNNYINLLKNFNLTLPLQNIKPNSFAIAEDISLFKNLYPEIDKIPFSLFTIEVQQNIIEKILLDPNKEGSKIFTNKNSLLESNFYFSVRQIDFDIEPKLKLFLTQYALLKNSNFEYTLDVCKNVKIFLDIYDELVLNINLVSNIKILKDIILQYKEFYKELQYKFVSKCGKKFAIFDTNFLINNYNTIDSIIKERIPIISNIVINELDNLKNKLESKISNNKYKNSKELNDLNGKLKNIRKVISSIKEWEKGYEEFCNNIEFKEDILKFIQGDSKNNDDKILSIAFNYSFNNDTILYTGYKNLQNKARKLNIKYMN